MTCNVCGSEARCYQLREIIENPGMVRNGEGMVFRICAVCLGNLIAGIKTESTKIETADDIPLPERVAACVAAFSARRDTRLGAIKNPIKIP